MGYIGKSLGSITTEARTVDTMVGDGSTSTLALTKTPGSVNNVEVFYDGIFQTPGEDFTLVGSTLTFTTAPTTGINVVAISGDDSQVVFPEANSITTKKILDNTITSDKFVDVAVEKLSGTLPAVDGTAVTGMNLPDVVDVTTAASDPTRTTNKPVGSLAVNSTSGEMFICTDAETDNNTWMNVGLGNTDVTWNPVTGYQGTQYGYISGGSAGPKTSNIEKFSFVSDGNGVVVGNLTIPRGIMGGCSSTTYGHSVGGNSDGQGGGTTSVIDRFSFASNGDATNWSNLSIAKSYAMTWTEWDVSGYAAMGGGTDMIEKFSFASSSTGVDTGANVFNGWIYGSATHTDRVNGYGYGSGGQGGSDIIHRYQFNTSNNSVNVGTLQFSQRSYHNGINSATHGFTIGGYGTSYSPPGKVEKFAFSSGIQSVLWGVMGDVNDAGGANCGTSEQYHGYLIGGQANGGNLTRSWKFSFASLSAHIHIGDLSAGEPSAYPASNQY